MHRRRTSQPTWPFADVGQLYTTNKVIYLSPQFYGVDFGIAYEPNTGNVGDGGRLVRLQRQRRDQRLHPGDPEHCRRGL